MNNDDVMQRVHNSSESVAGALLETIREVVVKRITVIKFALNDGDDLYRQLWN